MHFFLVIEDEVIGNESLDNHFARWISVMINFILSDLGIFAQAMCVCVSGLRLRLGYCNA